MYYTLGKNNIKVDTVKRVCNYMKTRQIFSYSILKVHKKSLLLVANRDLI